MIVNVLIVSIVGGILCLDRIFVQALISRPIVAAPVIGLILGDPYTGLIAGAFIELFWILTYLHNLMMFTLRLISSYATSP